MMRQIVIILVVILVGCVTPITANAQESSKSSWETGAQVKFWIEPASASQPAWYPPRIEQHVGSIVEFDDKQFVAQLRGGETEFTVPAQRVLWLQPLDAPKNELVAIEQFNAGQFEASLRPLLDALNSRPPVWRQQWLSVVAAQAAMRTQRYKIALELVSQIDRRPLPPLVISWLPVVWQTRMNDAAMQSAAAERLSDPSPATRLVAASWLLSSSSRAQATSVLRTLEADESRSEIVALARVLLWQVVPPPEVGASIAAWQKELDALPMVLQTGPTLTLVARLNSSGNGSSAKPLEQSLELTPIHPHPDVNHQ